jgi:hypothetical protein
MHIKRLLAGCLLAGFLVSCIGTEPEQLDFDTDPRILRGTWLGTYQEGADYFQEGVTGKAITFVIKADYLNEGQYAIEDTLHIA